MRSLLTLIRRCAGVLISLEIIGLVGLMVLTQVAQHAGYPVFVIRGSSMAPGVPLGALVIDQPVDPALIATGDVVSVRATNGVVYTHRVSQVSVTPDGPAFQTRGDANPVPDQAVAPASAVIGRMAFYLPIAGYVAAFLTLPTGALSLFLMVLASLLVFWLLEDIERSWGSEEVPAAPHAGTLRKPVEG